MKWNRYYRNDFFSSAITLGICALVAMSNRLPDPQQTPIVYEEKSDEQDRIQDTILQKVSIASLIEKRIVTDTNLVLPPSWAFGMLYGAYTNQKQTIQRVDEIIKRDFPIDAYWIDSWFWSHAEKGRGPDKYIDFVADTVGYPNRTAMWSHLQKNGIKGGFWIWDCIQQTGNEEAFDAFKSRNFFRDVYVNTSGWHNKSTTTAMFEEGKDKQGTPTGNIDFKNPEAVAFFKQKMKPFFDEGADFMKLDRTSSIEVCKAMFETTQQLGKETKGRGFILSHTGGMENETYKKYPAKWTDDTRSDWTIENPLVKFDSWVPKVALKENIAMYTDPLKSSSQIPFLTNDLGGFDMGKTTQPEVELYIRWLQFAMFGSITEVFSQPENPTANMPWNYGKNAEGIFRDYAKWRMQLFPYIYSNAHLARITGKHILGKIPGRLYEFMLGDAMLIAPVYEKGATTRDVFLPEGTWTNHWTGEQLKGNRTYIVQAPLEQVPVFYKQGAIVPMRDYASSVEKGNNDKLFVHLYPTADGSFHLIEDDGLSNDYLEGGYASTVIEMKSQEQGVDIETAPVDGKYQGMSAKRSWVFLLHDISKPQLVKISGKNADFTYDGKSRTAAIPVASMNKNKGFCVSIQYSR